MAVSRWRDAVMTAAYITATGLVINVLGYVLIALTFGFI